VTGEVVGQESEVIERAVQLLGNAVSLNGNLPSRLEKFAEYEQLIDILNDMGHEELASDLSQRVVNARKQLQGELRQQFVDALRDQQWLVALETGELISRLFPISGMAADFSLLQPRIASKIQEQIDSRRSANIKSGDESEPSEDFNDAEVARLSVALSHS